MKTVATKNAPAALGPYAQAQVSGGFVFTSGQIGIDPATGAIAEGIEAQAHQVFRNLTAVLQAAGCNISIGTDNMAEDMVEATRTAMFMERVRRTDGREPTPEEAFGWATRNGYRAMGVADGGVLAPPAMSSSSFHVQPVRSQPCMT